MEGKEVATVAANAPPSKFLRVNFITCLQ